MPSILSGREAREALMPALAERVLRMAAKPSMAIIQVGDRPDSTAFIGAKKKLAQKLGIAIIHERAAEDVSQAGLASLIGKFNTDPAVQGVILQLPLPAHLDRDAAIGVMDPRKDVDGITSVNMSLLLGGSAQAIVPATARGIRELLKYYKIGLVGKHVVVVGRSDLVGKPVAAMCANMGAEVTVCHSKTTDLAAETRRADILIVAVGKPGLIQARHVKKGATVIDVGINTLAGEKLEEEIGGRKLVGDVDFEAVSAALGDEGAITPVPGGVGPMTVLALFENLADICDKHAQ